MNEISVLYDVSHAHPFGYLTVLFIALTGLNAGSYLASFFFVLSNKKDYLPLAKISGSMVLILWVLAPLLLLFNIGQPLRFWHLFAFFQPQSPMAWGTLILTAYPFLASVYLYHLFREDLKKAKNWGLLCLPIAIGSHGFVGFVLSFTSGRILWATSLTPIFFLTSSALSGLALVIILDTLRYYFILKTSPEAQAKERLIFHQMGEAVYLLIFAELSLILFYLIKIGLSPHLFNQVLGLINEGKLSSMGFSVTLIAGLIVPLILLIFPRSQRSPVANMIAASLIIIGIFWMTHLVLYAGQEALA
jgi:tetrathionate reductase subunit C